MQIVGTWRKTTDDPCAARYPDELEFTDRGVYTGRAAGGLPLWDAGGYEVLEGGRVRISTANDAEIPYRFSLAGDTLTFTDPEGCRFGYRRAG